MDAVPAPAARGQCRLVVDRVVAVVPGPPEVVRLRVGAPHERLEAHGRVRVQPGDVALRMDLRRPRVHELDRRATARVVARVERLEVEVDRVARPEAERLHRRDGVVGVVGAVLLGAALAELLLLVALAPRLQADVGRDERPAVGGDGRHPLRGELDLLGVVAVDPAEVHVHGAVGRVDPRAQVGGRRGRGLVEALAAEVVADRSLLRRRAGAQHVRCGRCLRHSGARCGRDGDGDCRGGGAGGGEREPQDSRSHRHQTRSSAADRCGCRGCPTADISIAYINFPPRTA